MLESWSHPSRSIFNSSPTKREEITLKKIHLLVETCKWNVYPWREIYKKAAKKINRKLLSEYSCDLGLGLTVGKGLTIIHHTGIVVTSTAIIGENLTIRQNTTIGRSQSDNEHDRITIGNNVDIGAHSFILGSGFKIGDNVKIGAMSFIMDEIPSNCTYVTRKESRIISK